MELKIEVQGLDEAISRLDRISRGARQQLRSAMLSSVRDVQRTAREKHKFVTRSGEAERSIESNVQFSGDTWVGTVGTTRKITIYLHQGTPKHVITPKRKLALRWTVGGKFVFAKRVYHPGTKRDPFIFNAANANKRQIIGRFENAVRRVFEEVK